MKNILLFVLLLLVSVSVFAQEHEEKTENLLEKFPISKYTYRFTQKTDREYLRFPFNVPAFDPLDLKYAPFESWDQTDWGLLARYEDSYTYTQLLMLKNPAESWIYQGVTIGEEYGFLDDFYLYATLFVSDAYPDNGGSCYVYYSDSLLKGLSWSTGIMVDPESGIFQVDNIYEMPYNLTNKSHDLNIVQPLNGEDFPIDENNIPASSYAAGDYKYDLMDDQFVKDWDSVKAGYHLPGSTVRAYRVELIREGTNLRVYINGKLAGELDDSITDTDADGNPFPSQVSWSYGPVLYTEGETVTCSIGALYIMGPKTEEIDAE